MGTPEDLINGRLMRIESGQESLRRDVAEVHHNLSTFRSDVETQFRTANDRFDRLERQLAELIRRSD